MSELQDPRVFFAAERTLLAWNRTGLTLMAFGFVIERFGLFVHMLFPQHAQGTERGVSFWIGIAFILLGAFLEAAAVIQFRSVLRTLKPAEIPEGYWIYLGVLANLTVTLLALILIGYLFAGSPVAPR